MAKMGLAYPFGALRGGIGNIVATNTKYGLVARNRAEPNNPKTAKQQGARANFTKATRAWQNLSDAQFAAWQEFAKLQSEPDPLTGMMRAPQPFQLFTSLACKFLQVSPSADVPLDPPSEAFFGDSVALTAAAAPGGILFTAKLPNREHVVVELLAQKIAHRLRAPRPGAYRTQAFFAFSDGELSFFVPLAEGTYSPAYRFGDARTGQHTGLAVLGAVAVSG